MVQASGLALAAREIVLRPEIPPQVIRLTRRRPIEGRVVDAQGRPVAAPPSRPAGSGFTGVLGLGGRHRLGWPIRMARCPDHRHDPPRRLQARVSDRSANVDSIPESGEVTITLHRPQHLHGTVTDAETGRPIERFTLIHGSGPALPFMRPVWNRDAVHSDLHERPISTGATPWAPDDNGRQSILIEADGYLPGESLGFSDNSRMSPMISSSVRTPTTISGVVRGPDGRPWPAPGGPGDLGRSGSDAFTTG